MALRYEACLEALAAGIAATRPGRRCDDVHDAVAGVLDRHSFLDGFRKRAGYSLGIAFAPDWGEGNVLSLNTDVDTALEPGMVFHIPVTLRDWGRYTIAVSECVEVTADGNRPMSGLERDLVQA